jgi:mRNA interferase MazF
LIKQGDIIQVSFDPTKGREQQGYRPAVVISNDVYNAKTDFRVVCPISSTSRKYSLYVSLDSRTKTTGTVLADQIKTIDIKARPHKFVEDIPDDILDDILEIAQAIVDRI